MKSDLERGPFGAWAFRARDQLDLSVEDVAARLGYHPASLRKIESGSAPPSRRMVRELPALYGEFALDKGVTLSPPPGEMPAEQPGDLAAAIRDQTAAMRELVEELREAREAQQGRDEGLAAVLADLGDTLERLQPAPIGTSRSNNG